MVITEGSMDDVDNFVTNGEFVDNSRDFTQNFAENTGNILQNIEDFSKRGRSKSTIVSPSICGDEIFLIARRHTVQNVDVNSQKIPTNISVQISRSMRENFRQASVSLSPPLPRPIGLSKNPLRISKKFPHT